MKIFSFCLLAALVVFVFWALEVQQARVLVRQYQAQSFSSVPGEILSGEVTVTHGSKGSVHYHVRLNYRYQVVLQNFYGWCYRYDGHPNDAAGAYAVVRAHPPHSTVTVFYDPENPADALLSPGVDDRDVFQLFFITPMVLFLMWALWRAGRLLDWPWLGAREAGGVKLISDGRVTHLRLPRYDAVSVALLTTAGLSLVAGVLMSFMFTQTPPLVAGGWLMAAVLAVGGLVFAWFFVQAQSGRQDLVMDEAGRTLRLPLTFKQHEEPPLDYRQITGVYLDKIRHSSKGGAYYTYMVLLQRQDGTRERLVELNQSRAESLAAWLRQKLGMADETPVLNPEP